MVSATEPDCGSGGALHRLIGYEMRRASSIFAAEFARAVHGTGMRQAIVGILSIVAANPGINQGNAGRILGIQPGNMVSLVDELVHAGLVTRKLVIGDRRVVALYATAPGLAVLDDCAIRIRANEDRLLVEFSEDERATLLALLNRIQRTQAPA